jgi:hypothetical protein
MEPGLSADGTDASTSRIVHWEILKGLPGEGPVPKYFHLGHPTPWSEGLVVRFWDADGTEWVGNFQNSRIGSAQIVPWPEANVVGVKTSGHFSFDLYLIHAGNPADYSSHIYLTGIMFNEDRSMLFVSDGIRIIGYRTDRKLAWVREGLGGYDLEMKSCVDGVLTVELEEVLGEPRKVVRLSANDGSNV